MSGRRRTVLAVEAERRNHEQLARLGSVVRQARYARSLTQEQLGRRTGLSRMAISRAERGRGGGLTVDAWQRIGLALGMPLVVNLQRDPRGDTADAGHLGIQELALRLGRGAGYLGHLELPTRPDEPWRSIDVALVDDARRRLIVSECWNTFGDIGASARSSTRKLAEAEQLATLRWGDTPHRVGLVWIVRATARNRALITRYPEVFAARFPGSSAHWVRALTTGADPPSEPGLVWASVDGQRVFAWAKRPAGVAERRPRPERVPERAPPAAGTHPSAAGAGAPMDARPRDTARARNREDAPMNHQDHVALIRDGVTGAGPRWLELGAGDGEFTLALADLLGPSGHILALDRDRWALAELSGRVAARFPGTPVHTVTGDFTEDLPDGPFDVVLAANSLHFVADPLPVLEAIRGRLGPGGRLVIVEYDADHGNPYVPHPITFARWRELAPAAGFARPYLLHRVPSRFLGAIYAAAAAAGPDPARAG